MSKQANAVIVGGGIMGCSIAYALIRRGVRNLVLLERRRIASGPTGVSSGVLRQLYFHPTLIEMAKYGRDFYAHCHDHLGATADFVEAGWLLVAGEPHAERMRSGSDLQSKNGVRSTLLSAAEIRSMVPHIHVEDSDVGLYESNSGYADPYSAAHAFARAAREGGAAVYEDCEVIGIDCDGSGVCAVRTGGDTIATRIVINAAGSWADRVGRMVGVDLPIETSRHQLVSIQRPTLFGARHPIISDAVNLVYLKPEGQHITVVGSTHPDDARDLVDPDHCPPRADQDKAISLWQEAVKRIPLLAEGGMVRGWSGVYDTSPDGFPIIDGPLGPKGFYCVAGLSGHGFKLAPSIGTMMASLVLDGHADPKPRIFRLSRFAEGEPITSPSTTTFTTMKRQERAS
ncbi:MAG: NAD(P)/FAD-dependent oxidoreductase [bacterium]